MTDIVERLRHLSRGQGDVRTVAMTEAADEIERLRKRIVELDGFVKDGNEQQVAVENENGWLREDLHRLDELMSAIAMEWVKLPEPSPQQPRSPLDLAIMAAAHETTGMHRRRKERGDDD